MTSISERESREIEAANASGNTPVVFIHGLWLLPGSWDNWAEFFRQAGYAPLTPDWPGDPATVKQARAEPEAVAKKTLAQVAGHTTEVIEALDRKPAVMGHSTGALLAQMLAGRGLSAATLAIDTGVFRGVLPLPAPVLKGGGPFLVNPRTRGRPRPRPRDHADLRPVQIQLGQRAGRERGHGALRHLPRRRLGDRAGADGQREPQPADRGEGGHGQPRPRPAADHRRREGPHGAVGDRARRLPAATAQPRGDRDREDPQPGPLPHHRPRLARSRPDSARLRQAVRVPGLPTWKLRRHHASFPGALMAETSLVIEHREQLWSLLIERRS